MILNLILKFPAAYHLHKVNYIALWTQAQISDWLEAESGLWTTKWNTMFVKLFPVIVALLFEFVIVLLCERPSEATALWLVWFSEFVVGVLPLDPAKGHSPTNTYYYLESHPKDGARERNTPDPSPDIECSTVKAQSNQTVQWEMILGLWALGTNIVSSKRWGKDEVEM